MNKKIFLNIAVMLGIFVALSAVFTFYKYTSLNTEREASLEIIDKSELSLVSLEQKLLTKELKRVISDIFLIKTVIENDVLDFDYPEGGFQKVEKSILNMLDNRLIYDQIRYLDENGQEVIRVDLNGNRGFVCSSDKLQNKADRYYFKDAMAIENGEVYVSKLDLNMENGVVEEPRKPMIRIATKIYDNRGKERGIIISNYYADILIEDFLDVANEKHGSAYLVNADSYWISNIDDPETEFAFMFDDKKEVNFKNTYPNAFDILFNEDEEFYESDTDIFYSKKIIPFVDLTSDRFNFPSNKIVLGDGNLKVISHIKKSEYPDIYDDTYKTMILKVVNNNKFNFVVLFILSILFTLLFNLYQKNRRNLKFFSERDVSTGILNRHAGMKKIEALLNKSNNLDSTLCIIFIDVNGLKLVNDQLGHKYGDELINTVVMITKDVLRENDVFFRYGGDEFIICLEKVDEALAEKIWYRIVQKAEEINSSNALKYNVSISHGISVIDVNEDVVDIKKHINWADEKMYEEKLEIKKTAVIIK